MRFVYGAICIVSLNALVVYDAIAEMVVQTQRGRIFSVADDGKTLDEIDIDKDGEITRKKSVTYEAIVRGEIKKVLPYAEDSLILYTSNKKILLHRKGTGDFQVLARDIDVKDMALIGEDLYILKNGGNLLKQHVSSPNATTLVDNQAWAHIVRLISVGTSLVTLSTSGEIFNVNLEDLSTKKIGSKFDKDFDIEAFDQHRLVVLNTNRPVYIKEVATGKNILFSTFFQGMPIENKLLFKKKNIVVIRTDTQAGSEAEPSKNDPNKMFFLPPLSGGAAVMSHSVAPQYLRIERLTAEEIAYVERFNSVAKEISDFPPPDRSVEDYFHIYKNVDLLEDAEVLMFGEIHTHSMSQIWSASVINKLISTNDVVLFEGAQAKTAVNNVGQRIISEIFATREYERIDGGIKDYIPTVIGTVRSRFAPLFDRTKNFLALDVLKIDDAKGFYWDLMEKDDLSDSLAKRNKSMVETIKSFQRNNKVFVLAGARHVPSYDFAKTLLLESKYETLWGQYLEKVHEQADSEHELTSTFYEHFREEKESAQTKVIFDYLKGKKFALFIPKNLQSFSELKPFLPKSPK